MIFKRRGRSEGGVKKISDVFQKISNVLRKKSDVFWKISDIFRKISDVFFDMLYDVAVIIGNRNIC